MAQRPRSLAAFVAGILTIFALGIVWTVVLHNLPTQMETPAAPSPSAADPPFPPPSASPSPPPSTMLHESAPNPTLSPPPITRGPRVGREVERTCLAVLEKLCQDSPPGGGRRRKCFQDNLGNLSPACQVTLQAQAFQVREGPQQFKAACEVDARRLCPQVPGGRMLQCLEDHTNDDLSDSCYRALENRPLRR